MAGSTAFAAELGRCCFERTWDQGDGTSRSTRGSGFTLCASQAISTTELRGIGLSFGGLGVVYLVRPPASVVVTKEVGLATDDQRDQRGKLGGDQPRGVEQRTAAEIR